MSEGIIIEGCRVIIQRGSYLKSEQVKRKVKVNIPKCQFYLDNAVGCTYGTIFKIIKHHLVPLVSQSEPKLPLVSGVNNQHLNDDGESQKLTRDDIMVLKEKGCEGEDIIEQLVENSETFIKKTEFSQEKYVNKKKERHLTHITLLQPTLSLVCRAIYSNCSLKILELRMDTASQILTMANIHSDINVLLMESTQSFVAGLILHRMGGLGNVVQIYNGDFPIRLMLSHFGLSDDETKILTGFPMHKINNVDTMEKKAVPADVHASVEDDDVDHFILETPTQNGRGKKRKSKQFNKPMTSKEKHERKVRKIVEENRALELLKTACFDCLIIATKFHTKTALLKLIKFVLPSRPIVVYSPYKEVLNECYISLKESKTVVNLHLTETWWRSYQVLPQRTHPLIMMDGVGGYLLTAITVEHDLKDKLHEKNLQQDNYCQDSSHAGNPRKDNPCQNNPRDHFETTYLNCFDSINPTDIPNRDDT